MLFRSAGRTVLKAKAGARVSQLAYAKRGIVTPEMEFVALRENMKLQRARELLDDLGQAELAHTDEHEFIEDLKRARSVLYVLDTAGEAVARAAAAIQREFGMA